MTKTLLALHGGPGRRSVQPIVDRFGATHEVLAPTHAGWDGTPRPDWYEGVDDLAIEYLDLLDDQNLDDVVLIASSFGGWVAAEMAVRDRGRRISGVVLIDVIGPRIPGHSIAMPNMDDTRLPEAVRANFGHYTARHPQGDPRLLHRVGRVAVPVLFIWGGDDRIVGAEYGRAYAEHFPKAEFVLLPGVGHAPLMEAPERTLDLIDDFLRS
ncbi:alpha/beta fold hydrolase [Kutzneria kofuensis]|uniref:Pimeloyl-ACP methyl ester carboxylesterase n=1 Tax=Kutzneria kofuensis TaxID=103725 RepID=A0A7W9NLU0_9PSEU|nr:alpha/beta hydrolase [Kutzneria kofuensis]MBB5897410.1 pimeloyl-ACP methyl ester carboxylesterase [Kutzneria kofuensis]